MRLLFASVLATALLAGCGGMSGTSRAADMPARAMDGVLVGPNGMTLYTFERDTAGSGKSVCNGQCAANWPPLMASGNAQAAGGYSVITRDDGRKQWAYQGRPLYYWVKDAKVGDRTGDGMLSGAWKAARP